MAAARQGARARDHLASLAAPERQPMWARAAPRAKGWAVPACAAPPVCKECAMLDDLSQSSLELKSRVGPCPILVFLT